jgi:hypothetical protein
MSSDLSLDMFFITSLYVVFMWKDFISSTSYLLLTIVNIDQR